MMTGEDEFVHVQKRQRIRGENAVGIYKLLPETYDLQLALCLSRAVDDKSNLKIMTIILLTAEAKTYLVKKAAATVSLWSG